MTTDTTKRMPALTTKEIIANYRNRLACLMMKRINQTLTAEDQKDEAELHKKLYKLEREQIEEMESQS